MSEDEKHASTGSGMSRRDFFKSGTTGALSTGLLAHEVAQGRDESEAEILGPDEVTIQLSINGRVRQLQVEPRVTLLDALRNELGLTGAKKVCDRSVCGACTVLMDGEAVYACAILAIEAQGKQIETVEGLGSEKTLHPLQEAFVENDAQECGFCIPGFVMSAKALLDKNPSPSDAQIKEGLGGNLCRCGSTYVAVHKAVRDVASKGGSHA
jgi:xanthine dehydrogenase YagT iron-sulfur-binding subunit